jgi:hypothetical protein
MRSGAASLCSFGSSFLACQRNLSEYPAKNSREPTEFRKTIMSGDLRNVVVA